MCQSIKFGREKKKGNMLALGHCTEAKQVYKVSYTAQ